ncbi:class I SAM-dependent methyltransferase [Pseudomonas eucalypticola]|uniref:Methyltransferase domain-containing protein n=1 Tax=Pseudomonas eucalypticola TaxID=2599595 RepID=A0A7D5D5U3_9PSED|nr:class I SAM-dependent methyltransferase [Pseudomonas eucalypticola]QKZ03974.1 methyltransferase domain-containing protein [Pseudomonas eucalypticola]
MSIHHAAEGYDTPATADTYVRGRPDYPPALDAWLRDTLNLHTGSTVLDLGAGTGKFTARLLATGARVVAVEPVPAMREKLHATYGHVQALDGRADAIPLPDASLDAVVCAQSFHWFATPEAVAEIRRVLKPGGRLGLVWNLRDNSVPWVARLDALVNQYEGDTPRYYSGAWRQVFPAPGFSALQHAHFGNGHTGSPDAVILDRVRSTSFIAGLAAAQREAVDAQVRALIASEPLLAGKAEVTVPYTTAAFCAVKSETP